MSNTSGITISKPREHKPEAAEAVEQKTFLHVGCGPQTKAGTTAGFNTDAWRELRFDIDERVAPDFVGTMTDMSAVPDESVDAVYSSHNIEHLWAHEIPLAIKEFLRVLKPTGFLVLTCPDIQTVCELVAQDKLLETAYVSPAGPIAPFDILYGHRGFIAAGNEYMAHKSGFTSSVMMKTLEVNGFERVAVARRSQSLDLWVVAFKSSVSDEEVFACAREHFPPGIV